MHRNCADVIAELLFAYVNKDEDIPHTFEIHAVEEAVMFLKEHYQGEKYTQEWFQKRLMELKESYL